MTPERTSRPGAAPLIVRLAWFVGLWAAGVGGLAAIALVLRKVIG